MRLRPHKLLSRVGVLAIGVVALSTVAVAVDLPPPPSPAAVAPIVEPAALTWSGFYGGPHGGYGWGYSVWTLSGSQLQFWGDEGTEGFLSPRASLFGGQIGYLHQTNGTVFGIDFSASKTHMSDTIGGPQYPISDSWTVDIDYLFLAQARIGVAGDGLAVFLQGGYAAASARANAFSTVGPTVADGSAWHNGWTIGAAILYRVAAGMSVGAEYNYVHLATVAYDLVGDFPGFITVGHRAHIAKLVVNLHLRKD